MRVPYTGGRMSVEPFRHGFNFPIEPARPGAVIGSVEDVTLATKHMDDYEKGYGFRVVGQTAFVRTIYPRAEGHVNAVEVGMECVRAADSIRIVYDFDRDGYSIMQASRFAFEADDEVCDPDWQEVAFVQAWAREVTGDVNG